jgi:hypothetical protein
MGFKIDKTQAIGAVAIASVALGVSWYQGKFDKYLGKEDTAGMFERKLPPPIEGADPLIATEPTSDASSEDVLAQVAGETSEADAFVNEMANLEPAFDSSAASDNDPLAAIAAAPAMEGSSVIGGFQPSAQLASTDPSIITAGGVAFTNVTPSAPTAGAPATVASSQATPASTGPRVFGASGSANSMEPPALPNHATLPDPTLAPAAQGLPAPAPTVLSAKGPGPSLPASASAPVSIPAANGSAPVVASISGGSSSYSNPAAAAAAIASLPSNATGKDLLELQTQLALLDKQKAIAAGHEAIAESRLKTAKAAYEMAQIGQPSAEERAAMAAAYAASQVNQITPPAPPTSIETAKLLSTSRANGGIGATLLINGKLVDVKKGSLVGGLLIDKVTDNSVTLIGDGKSQTVWID